MFIYQIIHLTIGLLAIGQQFAVCSPAIQEQPKSSTVSQIVSNNYTIKTSATSINTNIFDNATLTTSNPLYIKKAAKLVNKGLRIKKEKKDVDISSVPIEDDQSEWRCPNITGSRSLECACDLPQTLRCNGGVHGLAKLAENLRTSPYSVALLDVSLRNVTFISDARIFDQVSLRCLIISSGEIKRVHKSAFLGIKGPLLALGLPGNALLSVPWSSISILVELERLDLSNNRIKALGTSDLATLVNLEYLDLSNNHLSSISQRTFVNLRKLEIVKLGGNRLGDYAFSLKALTQCFNLRDLDISANNINGPLTAVSLPILKNLAILNLDQNLIKSIQNKAFVNFSKLKVLTLRHNQIDVLQDHAFFELGSLETLDLSYNGIVAISGASLQHLTRLTILDLTHNFLRALTSDLVRPLPSLTDLRLSGNDISIVARNALDGAQELKSISMQENPLSCDCTIRNFSEWLQTAHLVSQDLLTITCATPPKLEGAPLIQIPVEMLNCEMENEEKDNANIIEQLEAIAKKNHSKYVIQDFSGEIILHDLRFSTEYGLSLTWIIMLSKTDYICDAIFVYKEEDINEILIDNSPIHCESKIINGLNTVSVIIPDSSLLDIGESYRFCLVMVQEYNPLSDVTVGCSNITQLQINNPEKIPKSRQFKQRLKTDIIKFDDQKSMSGRKISTRPSYKNDNGDQHTYAFLNSLNKSFLPGIGLGILVTSMIVMMWGVLRLRQNHYLNRHNDSNRNHESNSSTATTCYAASEHIARLTDSENQTRYLKLQATTSL